MVPSGSIFLIFQSFFMKCYFDIDNYYYFAILKLILTKKTPVRFCPHRGLFLLSVKLISGHLNKR